MKKNYLVSFITLSLIVSFTSCTKKNCTEGCVDLTSAVAGKFSGSYLIVDSSNSSTPGIPGPATTQVTKVNDTTVSFEIISATPLVFDVVCNAKVTPGDSGYSLTVISGNPGEAAYYHSPADGIYVTSKKQLTLYIEMYYLPGSTYCMSYTGTQQ